MRNPLHPLLLALTPFMLYAQGDRPGGGKSGEYATNLGQFDCCRKINRKNNGNLPPVYIYIDPNGVPNPPVHYVPYGAQVNVLATNVNPFLEIPRTTIAFQTFNSSTPAPAKEQPSVSGGNASKPDEQKEELIGRMQEKASMELISNRFQAIATSIEKLSKQDSGLKSLVSNLDEVNASIKDFNKSTLDGSLVSNNSSERVRQLEELKNQIAKLSKEMQKITDENKRLEEDLKTKIESLQKMEKEIKALNERMANRQQFQNNYDSFTSALNRLNNYLGLEAALNVHFRQQFISRAHTYAAIMELVRSRLPGAEDSLKNIATHNRQFLDTVYAQIFSAESRMAELYQAINKFPEADSFATDKKVSVDLKSKDGKVATLTVDKYNVVVKQKPLFKEQMDYVNEKMKWFRNDSIRRALGVHTDTLLQRMRMVCMDNFERPIKTFQATADDIKVTLPHRQAEPLLLQTYCKLKVSGSTGVFVHFGAADEKTVIDKDNAGNNLIVRQKPEAVLYSFGLLAHFYRYDPRKTFNVGGSLGLNVPVNNQGGTGFLQLAGGLSLHTTTIDKLIITFGLSVRKGQKLNTENLVKNFASSTYTFQNTSSTSVTMDNVTRVGAFLGFSYSIFGTGRTTQSE